MIVDEAIEQALDVICLREVQKSVELSVKREVVHSIVSHNAGAYFEIQDKRIKTSRGGVIIFDGMQNFNADNVKSLAKFHRAFVEEAHSLSSHSLAILRPTMRHEWVFRGVQQQAQLWFAWNPESAEDAVDEFFRGANPPPNAVVINANWDSNPWFNKTLQEEREHDLRATTVGDEAARRAAWAKYRWVWEGAYYEAGDAQVFTNWRVEEFEAPPGTHFRFGADWGFAIDPSVLVRCWVQGRRLYVDYEAYQIGCEIDKLPDLFMSVPEAEKWACVADSARPETISYMRNHGFPRMTAAIKGPNSIAEGVQFLQSYEIVVHPRCKHTRQELKTYSHEIDKQTQKPLPLFADKNNHVVDALRYACEGLRRAQAQHQGQIVLPDSAAAPYARF